MAFPESYGWDDHWKEVWKETGFEERGLLPVRMTADYGQQFKVATGSGEYKGETSGRLRHLIEKETDLPAVGDWLAAELLPGERRVRVHGVLPRRSIISRKAAGTPIREQIIAANIDVLFLVTSLNFDLNIRRLERYLIMAWNAGTQPVILLSKADLCSADFRLRALADVSLAAPGVPIHIVSAQTGEGMEAAASYFREGKSGALVGTSGCGKSTLTNWLMGSELQHTSGIREDDSRGRHTTTHRQMFLLPGGGILIDTPGMRELQLWDGEEGCAVLEAVDSGILDAGRLTGYRKTQRELAFLERKEKSRSISGHPAGVGRKTKKERRSKHWSYED
ncbi:ribosome small subunit-dependent GTPase A [Saccharibacillus kuerlensis]